MRKIKEVLRLKFELGRSTWLGITHSPLSGTFDDPDFATASLKVHEQIGDRTLADSHSRSAGPQCASHRNAW
jgi:hypothetical protein